MEQKEQKETGFLVDDEVAMRLTCHWQRTKECRCGGCNKLFYFLNCLKTRVFWGVTAPELFDFTHPQ